MSETFNIFFYKRLHVLLQCMWVPNIWIRCRSQGKDWHVPHVRHDGSRPARRSTRIMLSLAVPLCLQEHGLKWQWKDHGLTLPGGHPSAWPLWETAAHVWGSPPEALASKGIMELCVICVWRVGIQTSEWGSNAPLEMQKQHFSGAS